MEEGEMESEMDGVTSHSEETSDSEESEDGSSSED
jgi:hypothetical protein